MQLRNWEGHLSLIIWDTEKFWCFQYSEWFVVFCFVSYFEDPYLHSLLFQCINRWQVECYLVIFWYLFIVLFHSGFVLTVGIFADESVYLWRALHVEPFENYDQILSSGNYILYIYIYIIVVYEPFCYQFLWYIIHLCESIRYGSIYIRYCIMEVWKFLDEICRKRKVPGYEFRSFLINY